MTKKEELITKQQLEIEELKIKLNEYKEVCADIRNHLWRPKQWSTKCPDFPKVAPKVAMSGIVNAIRAIDDM